MPASIPQGRDVDAQYILQSGRVLRTQSIEGSDENKKNS